MKRKVLNVLGLFLFGLALTSCSSKPKLLFLNWGEYVDESLLDVFEKKYNCSVVMDIADTNEKFYAKVSSGTTVYDIVCPSDYMVKKMYKNDMLSKLDYKLLPNYNRNDLIPSVEKIRNEMETTDDCSGVSDYFVPYLCGTWGIMYSTLKDGLEDAIVNSKNEWASLFDRSILPNNTRVAMYESYQHAYYAACRYLGYDTHKELSNEEFDEIHKLIKNMNFDSWGTDMIKKKIVANNLDVGFMWTGDFLYYYAENVVKQIEKALNNNDLAVENIIKAINDLTDPNIRCYKAESGNVYDVGFDIFIPSNTIAFSDNLVITKNSQNKVLAHEFINFMISNNVSYNEGEEEITRNPAFENTYYVCYDAPYKTIFNELTEMKNNEIDPEGEISDQVYDIAIGIAFDKYYPIDDVRGNILATFSRKYITKITSTFNNAKV